ncbi:MAG: fasciclin domain-containing protein [Pyrinomonadaceae bacterium]
MKKTLLTLMLCMAALGMTGATASAQMNDDKMMKKNGNPTVGGAAMFKTKNIVENAVESPIHTTLVAAVKAAGLVETLSGKGPFTVFAPTNDAFAKLPAGTVDTLVMPENKAMLTSILTYHVVAGRMDSKAIAKAIKKGKGKATFTTVNGSMLTATMHNGGVMLTDGKGGTAMVTTADVYQSNGVIHVIDTVVMPGDKMMSGGDGMMKKM